MEQMQEMLVKAVPAVGRGQRGFRWSQCQEGTKGDQGRQKQPWGQVEIRQSRKCPDCAFFFP